MITATDFWNWFKANNARFQNLNDPELSDDAKEELLNEFLEHLYKYCDGLYFEIGGEHGKEQELIITADGDTEYFHKVEELIDAAPAIDNWIYTALIQPGDLPQTTIYEDVELMPFEIYFLPLDNKNQPKSIGLRVCLPNYELVKDSEWLTAAVYKVLDHVLGEKVFALDIDYIEIKDLPDNPEEKGMMELEDLPRFIKWKKAKLENL